MEPNQPTLFSVTSRFVVRVLLPSANFAAVYDFATGRAVATGTRAACVEFAERLDRRSQENKSEQELAMDEFANVTNDQLNEMITRLERSIDESKAEARQRDSEGGQLTVAEDYMLDDMGKRLRVLQGERSRRVARGQRNATAPGEPMDDSDIDPPPDSEAWEGQR